MERLRIRNEVKLESVPLERLSKRHGAEGGNLSDQAAVHETQCAALPQTVPDRKVAQEQTVLAFMTQQCGRYV